MYHLKTNYNLIFTFILGPKHSNIDYDYNVKYLYYLLYHLK